jgi:uncharacterized LabA/DUF88 family protein
METETKIIYAFIDSQNLKLGVMSQGWRLDYARFFVFLQEKYKAEKVFLFMGYVAGNEQLYTELQKYGYVIVFKPTLIIKRDGKEKIKGNVDAELVLHSMIEYPNFNKSIIVSGDGDFHCLVSYFVEKKKLEKIIVPNERFSSLLRKYANHIVNINLFRGKVEKQ